MFKLFLSIGLSLSLNISFSQIRYSAKAGMNLSHWSTEGYASLVAFHAGGGVIFDLNDIYSLQTELLYSGKGSELPNYIPSNPMRFSQQYLSMPIVLGYRLKQVTFKLGQEVSYMIDSKIEVNEQEQEVPEAFKKWDWAIVGGASLQMIADLFLEVRYIYGLVDVIEVSFTDENGQDLGTLRDGKHRVLQLGVRYEF
jgi:hypothetical protein